MKQNPWAKISVELATLRTLCQSPLTPPLTPPYRLRGRGAPDVDGWLLSDSYALNSLLQGQGASQTWITTESPQDLVSRNMVSVQHPVIKTFFLFSFFLYIMLTKQYSNTIYKLLGIEN